MHRIAPQELCVSPPHSAHAGTQLATSETMRHFNFMRVLVAGAAIVAATGVVEAGTVGVPSSKSYGSVKQGSPYDWIEACDRDADGKGVYVEYWTYKGGHFFVWDGNGSKPGCGNAKVGPSSVKGFRVCIDDTGCSPTATP